MKISKKILMSFLGLIVLLSALTFCASAQDIKTYNVNSWETFKQALEVNEKGKITLTSDIKETVYANEAPVCIRGEKTLDLNGYTVKYENFAGKNDRQYSSNSNHAYMFTYHGGSKLTINDTSAKKTGKIIFDGYLGDGEDFVMPPIRDMFNVNGGELIINGGTFECGREKKDWVTALRLNGKLFTGNVRSQVYGSVFLVRAGGKVTLNDGTFIARGGYPVFDRDNTAKGYVGNVIKGEVKNSQVIINGGELTGKGGANIFGLTYPEIVTINNGIFNTSGIENALINYSGIDAASIMPGYAAIYGKMLTDNIEKKVIVGGDNVFTYKAGDSPEYFSHTREEIVVYTAMEFLSQSPAMPSDRVTMDMGKLALGESKKFSFKERALPDYMRELGFAIAGDIVVRDSSNKLVLTSAGTGEKSVDMKSLTSEGSYSITERITLFKDGKTISVAENIFIVELVNLCSHTFTQISNTATCTKAGEKTEVCSKCGESRTVASQALGHIYKAGEYSYNSTQHWYYCERCNNEIGRASHLFKKSICQFCGYNDLCQWGNAMDMEYDEGYHWWPCDTHSDAAACPNDCQLEKEKHYVRTIDNAGSLENKPTTEYNCQKGYVCDGCGEYFGETGQHKWVVEKRFAAKCNIAGRITYKCAYNGGYDCKGNKIVCNAEKTVTVKPLGHSFDYENPDSDTATCTTDGICTYTCQRRLCLSKTTKASPAKGHKLSGWEITKKATCTAAGELTATCTNEGCKFTDVKRIPATGHSYGLSQTVKEPTCTEEGENASECTNEGCQQTKTEKIAATGHNLKKVSQKAPTCTETGIREHYICQSCQLIFSDAAAEKPLSTVIVAKTEHSLKEVLTKASLTSQGKKQIKCENCDYIEETPIAKIASVKLSATKYTYNAKVKSPAVTVKDSDGNTLKKGTDYTVTYEKGRKLPGRYSVTVTFKGNYTGKKSLSFVIACKVPTALKQKSATTTAITLSWQKVTGADGYRVYRYDTSSKKYVKVKDVTATSLKITGLKAGTAYKLRVRAYTKDEGTIWGGYSQIFVGATKCKSVTITGLTSSKGKATVTWKDTAGETSYQLYYSENKTSGFKKYDDYKANTKKAVVSSLEKGKTYYFKVRACKKTADSVTYSAFSSVKSVKIK